MTPPTIERRDSRLAYRPGLDGLRALAVLAVLLYHAEVSWMPGGFLGVEVFLVISGYLITSLLLAEKERTQQISLSRFWWRRARRLLPALFVLLATTMVVAVAFLPDEVAGLRGDALASLGYVTNWYMVWSEQSYFETFGRPSLFQHLWSLAVEEQFYLIWPVLFAAGMSAGGRRRIVLGAAAGVAASTALMWLLFEPGTDPSRVYYGTDTRAAGLLIGVLLAFGWHPSKLTRVTGRHAPLVLDLVGVAALALLLQQFTSVSEYSPSLYRGGFARLSMLTAVAIAVAVHPAANLGRYLGIRPLRWIGLRSYSIYLWHWPVFMLTRPEVDTRVGGFSLMALRLAISFGLGALSYHFVEQPFIDGRAGAWLERVRGELRSGTSLLVQRWAMGTGAAALGALVLAGAVVAAERPPEPEFLVQATGGAPAGPLTGAGEGGAVPAGASAHPGATVGSGGEAASAGSPGRGSAGAGAGEAPAPVTGPELSKGGRAAPPTTTAVPAGRVLAIGDSVMLGAATALSERLEGEVIVDAVVSRSFEAGIWALQYHREAGTIGEVVVVHLGNNDAYFTDAQFDQMMEILRDVPVVVFLTVKVNQRYEAEVNTKLAAGVERWPNARLADWKGVSEAEVAEGLDVFAGDATHLDPAGATFYAEFVAAQLDR